MRKSLFVSIGWMVCLLGIAGTVQAQQPRIVDPQGNGVSDVTITMRQNCSTFAFSLTVVTNTAKSDSNGYFSWYTPAPIPCGMNLTPNFTYELTKTGFKFSHIFFVYNPQDGTNNLRFLIYANPDTTPQWVAVSSTNYAYGLATDLIMAGFGEGLATETISSARLPLATSLGNRRILVKDSAGVERNAKLIFVSPGQINFITPSEMANGAAVVRVIDAINNQVIKVMLTQVNAASPGLFSANGNGRGPAAAQIVRVKPGDLQTFEPVVQFDDATKQYVTSPIDFGPEDNQIFLVLYGTGFRRIASVSNVTVTLGGTLGTVTYAGPQPSLDGLDQINVKLPRTLIGRGEVDLVVQIEGRAANTLRIRIK